MPFLTENEVSVLKEAATESAKAAAGFHVVGQRLGRIEDKLDGFIEHSGDVFQRKDDCDGCRTQMTDSVKVACEKAEKAEDKIDDHLDDCLKTEQDKGKQTSKTVWLVIAALIGLAGALGGGILVMAV